MKAKDIIVGEDYEVDRSGPTRGTVVAVGKKTRRVYSGARWDFGGHDSTAVVVTVRWAHGGSSDVTPQQVKRLWSEGEEGRKAAEERTRRLTAATEALRELGLPAYAWHRDGSVNFRLSVEEAEALADRIRTAEDVQR